MVNTSFKVRLCSKRSLSASDVIDAKFPKVVRRNIILQLINPAISKPGD